MVAVSTVRVVRITDYLVSQITSVTYIVMGNALTITVCE